MSVRTPTSRIDSPPGQACVGVDQKARGGGEDIVSVGALELSQCRLPQAGVEPHLRRSRVQPALRVGSVGLAVADQVEAPPAALLRPEAERIGGGRY
ncbi:MAG: hypothetical protein ACRDPE_07525 [Solirubrobacterales bacterium]